MATATVLLDNGYDWLAVGSQGAFKIVLPDKDGIADIATDDNAPVEYYNLQGIRVDNPVPGNPLISDAKAQKPQKLSINCHCSISR